ncbi:MAG TPA: membrane dipeptidase, partial [Terriglobales bacterium]|nr:membrane dipeptidase [Terriglobales bacterium]
MRLSRRAALKAAGAAAIAPMINLGSFELFAQSKNNDKYSARAIQLVQQSTVMDLLNPFSLYAVIAPLAAPRGTVPRTWLNDPTTFSEASLVPFRESGINVYHIAVGTGGPNAYDETLRFLSQWNGFVAHHSDWFMRVDSPAMLANVKKSGKLGILLGVQNSEHFRSPADVDFFYSIGQRISQLTYNSRN